MAHKRKTLFLKIGKESAHNPNVQPFYSWSETHRFCTALRQVSRLIDHRIHHLPGFPVIYWLRSLITVTSSYRICTCFPFHRSQLHIACHKSDSNACLLRHLYATYSVSSCVAYAIAWIIILQPVTLFNRFLTFKTGTCYVLQAFLFVIPSKTVP